MIKTLFHVKQWPHVWVIYFVDGPFILPLACNPAWTSKLRRFVTVEGIILNINILGCTICISSLFKFCCEYCYTWGLFLMWYDHVINECFIENMNIAIVSHPLACNNTFLQVYSWRHVDMIWTIQCTWRYDPCTALNTVQERVPQSQYLPCFLLCKTKVVPIQCNSPSGMLFYMN